MTNLPDGVDPHGSDPPEQKYWTGQVHGSIVVHETVVIRWYMRCADEDAAIDEATRILLKSARAQHIGVDCEAGDDFRAEPD